jgi:hypothetical protein
MVQNYFNEELTDVCFEVEALDEWKQLNEELGLNLQSEFTNNSKSPIPYPWLNTTMDRIFTTLCGTKVGVEKYNKTPIPLEVLKQLKYCKDEEFFQGYEIWYDDKTPDPCLIGKTNKFYAYLKGESSSIKTEKGETMYFDSKEAINAYAIANNKEVGSVYEWDTKKYLIARWADVVRPINELKELVKERLIEKYGAELKNTLQETQSALQKLNENVLLYISGDITEGQLQGKRW